MADKIAIIRVRGDVNVTKTIKDTLKMLRLFRKNSCIIKEKTPSILGMVRKIEDYATWGEINEETLKLLKEKRATKKVDENNFFRLSPPKKGFGRKGIKVGYSTGGALGYRGSEINELIQRMI